jgi:hypothetical protein
VIPATNLEAIVVGVLMQLPPDVAQPHLDRLELGDFTDWRAATTTSLLADMAAAGVPTLDPAAAVGYAQRTGALSGDHKLSRVALWMADAYGCQVPAVALGFHIDLLLEASYRRHAVVYAKRIQQAAQGGALDLVDGQITTGYAGLAAHRQRFATTSTTRPGITPVRHPEVAA